MSQRTITAAVIISLAICVTAGGVARIAVSRAQQSKIPPKEAGTAPLPAEQALEKLQVADDLTVDLIASEPVVEQPVFLTFDERGRMWVVQYRQYPQPAGLKLLSKDRHYRSVYDKSPLPPGHPDHVPGADKITIHEDTDGDGTYDKVKTFVDGLNIVTSVAHGRGGVWVLNPPYLLYYPDQDRDDVPDGPPVVHLQGFGLEDTHSVVNSLRWGPDGWLYAAQGSTVSAHVKRPGEKSPTFHSHGQLVWRYHPQKQAYEIFAEGGGNIWGCVFDSAGRLFGGTNGTPRGYHYVQGGYYRKNFIKHGELSNPYCYGYFQGLEVGGIRLHNTITLYEGGALPARYAGTILGCNPLAAVVDVTRLTADGSTFTAQDVGIFVQSTDRWFRPVDAKVGPDGAVYIADWYDQQVRHTYNYDGRIDKSNGRIYRVRARDAGFTKPFDLATYSNDQLIDLLSHSNRWFRNAARRIIADRRDQTALPRLRKMIKSSTGQTAIEAFWALHACGGFTGTIRENSLRHTSPQIRSWAIRLIGDERSTSVQEAAIMSRLAHTDPSAEVRSQLASTARRLPAQLAMPIINGLLWRDEDSDDLFLPLLVWWALESKCGEDSASIIAMFGDQQLWQRHQVQQFILPRLMRRFASTEKRQDLVVCGRLLDLAPSDQATTQLMQGFEQAYRGRPMVGLPQLLIEQLDRLGGGSLVTRLRRSDPRAIAEALLLVVDRNHPAQERKRLIETFGEVTHDKVAAALISNLDDPDTSIVHASLVSLQAYSSQRIANEVLDRLPNMSPQLQAVACSLLASRSGWALRWVEAMRSGDIDKKLASGDALVDMRLHQECETEHVDSKNVGTTGAHFPRGVHRRGPSAHQRRQSNGQRKSLCRPRALPQKMRELPPVV